MYACLGRCTGIVLQLHCHRVHLIQVTVRHSSTVAARCGATLCMHIYKRIFYDDDKQEKNTSAPRTGWIQCIHIRFNWIYLRVWACPVWYIFHVGFLICIQENNRNLSLRREGSTVTGIRCRLCGSQVDILTLISVCVFIDTH